MRLERASTRAFARRAVFLDRDGTIVEEVPYLHEPEQVMLVRDAVPALRALARAGFALVVVTNQAGVAHGYYGEDAVERVHRRLRGLLAAGGVVLDGVWYCPHHPEGVVPGYVRRCGCRKPASGMLQSAARQLDLDLDGSCLIGNSPTDVGAALAAGVAPLFVTTGHAAGNPPPDGVRSFPTLTAAAEAILYGPTPPQPREMVRRWGGCSGSAGRSYPDRSGS